MFSVKIPSGQAPREVGCGASASPSHWRRIWEGYASPQKLYKFYIMVQIVLCKL